MKKTILFLWLLFSFSNFGYSQMTGIRVQQNKSLPEDTSNPATTITSNDTLTRFYYAYHKKNQKKVLAELKDLENEVSDITDVTNITQLQNLQKRIEIKKSVLAKYENYFDKIMKENGFKTFFPSTGTHKEDFFNMIYNKNSDNDIYFVNNAAVQLNNSGAAIQSELTSAFMGPLRFSFGTIVSNAKNNENTAEETAVEDTDAFKRLASGGGNIYLNAEFPLLYKGNNRFQCVVNSFAKGALDISEFSDDVDTSTGNGSAGGNLYASVATDKGEFNFFISGNYALYAGSNSFYERLQVMNHKPFGFGQLSVGVTILDRLRISCITNQFGSQSQLRSGKVIVGVQILSGLFKS
ncbi:MULTISPECIES: hypothetical protein [Flavobacterium]|nr:hypothetical protein [Flavobacterium sp. N1846]